MGIVNVTPDSFSDGGQHAGFDSALAHARRLLDEGADLLDVGGESTRPGAQPVDSGEEWRRVGALLRELHAWRVPLSLDTYQTATMARALELGVDIINDVRALRREGAIDVLAGHATAGVCLMHMQGEPGSMQAAPHYADVVSDVREFLRMRVEALRARGVADERIVLDPGIGFGKTVAHNLALLRRQRELLVLGAPLLVGWSRKSTLGALTGRAVDDRLVASVVAALLAVQQGASIVRVHDVAATVDALALWRELGNNNEGEPG